MDKGIIIGTEHETAFRPNLPFVLFRHATSVGLRVLLFNSSHMLIVIAPVASFSPSHLAVPT
jgi:hypothetical protein